MNQATPSLRWLNSKPKCTNRRWTVILTLWLLRHVVLNVWIMVCSELIAHRLTKCISLQRPNHHIGRDQSLLILTACVWNEERLSLLFLSHSEKYIPCSPFFSLNNFSFMKKNSTRITPHTEGQVKISRKKEKKLWESRKGKRAQETQWLGGMPKSQERVITKIKRVCPSIVITKIKRVCPSIVIKKQIKKERRKKRWTTQRVELLIVILSLWKPETLFEPYDLFFHNQKPQPTLRACRSPF